MSAVSRWTERMRRRQLIVGLVALPLSVVPFLAYGTFTPEGRLVRDRVRVALSPPRLPELGPVELAAAAAAAPRYQGKVMALVYHGIGSGSDGEGGFVVSPRRFGEHLATLRAAGMHTVTAADVARAFGAGKPLPDNAVMISFDDGRSDAIMWADPLLEQAGMQATMFVISAAAAAPGIYYAGWNRLRAAARSERWDIQAHTHDSHREQKVDGGDGLPKLTSLAPGESLDGYRRRIRDDLEENSAAILAHIGRRPVALAYPFGAYGAERTNDPGILEALRDEIGARFAVAFHQDEQDSVPLIDTGQDRVSLRRLEVGNWTASMLLEQINRTAGPRVPGDAEGNIRADDAPKTVSAPVVKQLPPVPFLPELQDDPAPIPPEETFEAPAPATTTTAPAPGTTATTMAGPPATTTPTTKPPRTTTTTTRPATTTTTGPPATTTTTTRPSPTTTTTVCLRVNGKPCSK